MKQPIKKTARKKVVINDAFRIHPSKEKSSSHSSKKSKTIAAIRAKKKAQNKAANNVGESVKSPKIKYVVVHSMGYSENISLAAIEQLPFDLIISPAGTIINNRVINRSQDAIEIGLIGGYDQQGILVDNHSSQQKDRLISLLMELMKQYPHCLIRSADELYSEKKPNPSFSLKALVMARIIDALHHLAIHANA